LTVAAIRVGLVGVGRGGGLSVVVVSGAGGGFFEARVLLFYVVEEGEAEVASVLDFAWVGPARS